MQLTVHIDGGSRGNPGPAAAGVSVRTAEGKAVFEAGYFLGEMTNNAAEYYGLIRALDALTAWPDAELTIVADSELLVRQITGEYRVRSPQLVGLYEEVQRRLLRRDDWHIRHVRREHNHRADELANKAMDQGEDVVVLDGRPGAAPPPRGNGHTTAPAAKPASATSSARVDVECVTPPAAPPCRAECRKGQHFSFSNVPPGDLCLDALSSMLHTVMALRDAPTDSDEDVPPLTVRCFKLGCGAVFELKGIPGPDA